MKKFFTLLTTVFFCLSVFAQSGQTTKTIAWGGTDRQYIEYVPSSYNASTPAPVLFVFHGLGDDMSNMFSNTGFKNIADQHGWIVITPQALEANVTLMSYTMSIGTAWNSGVSANLMGNNIIVNEGVDDSGLMMAILDDLIGTYNVDQNNVFCTGFSMGGFMSNRMAMEHGDRIRAIASVSGTIGNEIANATPVGHVSAMHIHGTADGTVTYDNASFNVQVATVSVGLGAEATVEYWRNYNQCSATPVHTDYPDNMSDGKTFEKFLYENGTNGTKTAFIKVTGGDHEWYYTPVNDIDYTTEIYNFFASCMVPTNVEEATFPTVNVYPNPTSDLLHVEGENIENIRIFNALGQMMTSTTSADIPVGSYSEGLYTVTVTFADGRTLTRKVMVK